MAIVDISKLTPEMRKEIKACKTMGELKAYFASKKISLSEQKLEAVFKLFCKFGALEEEELAAVSGGGGDCCSDCGTYRGGGSY